MKQIDIEYSPKFWNYTLYLEQIEAVVEYMKKQGCASVSIVTLGYEIDDISNLMSLPNNKTGSFSIVGKGSPPESVRLSTESIKVSIKPDYIGVFVDGGDWSTEHKNGIIAGIESILKTGDRKYINDLVVMSTGMIAPLISLIFVFPLGLYKSGFTVWVIITLLVYSLVALYIFLMQNGSIHNLVVFERKRDISTFVRRNGDRLIMLAIGWLVGTLINIFPSPTSDSDKSGTHPDIDSEAHESEPESLLAE